MGSATDNTNRVVVALCQASYPGSIKAVIDQAHTLCVQASESGADIALFPEMWTTGYEFFDAADPQGQSRWLAAALHEDEEPLASLRRHARDLNLAIAMGYLRKTKAAPENSCVLFDRHGQKVLTYSKVHTCPFEVEKYCQPGTSFPVVDLDTRSGVVRVGVMICFDREFPESARILTLNGAELILVPNACIIEEHRISQLRTRAFDNQVALAMANYPEPRFNGQSTAIDAVFFDEQGRSLDPVIASGGPTEEMVLATFDVERIRRYRMGAIWGTVYRRPEAYGMLTDTASPRAAAGFEPRINGNIRAPLVS